MTEVSYPSAQFPAMPSVRVQAPEGWTPVAAPGAVVAVRDAAADGHFAANVLITVQRHPVGYSLQTAIAAVRDELAGFGEAKVDEPFLAPFGDDRFVVVNTALTHPQFGPLVQVHAYSSYTYGALKDVVHVVGTCAGGRLREDYPTLQQVMESTRVGIALPAA